MEQRSPWDTWLSGDGTAFCSRESRHEKGFKLFFIYPFNMLWIWNLFNKSSGANEISDKLSKFCSDVKLCCLRWIHHLLSEKHCGEKVHWAGIWFCWLFVALCNKSWLLGKATGMLSYNALVLITCALWWDVELFLMHWRELWCTNLAAAWSVLSWKSRRLGIEQHSGLWVNLLRNPLFLPVSNKFALGAKS